MSITGWILLGLLAALLLWAVSVYNRLVPLLSLIHN